MFEPICAVGAFIIVMAVTKTPTLRLETCKLNTIGWLQSGYIGLFYWLWIKPSVCEKQPIRVKLAVKERGGKTAWFSMILNGQLCKAALYSCDFQSTELCVYVTWWLQQRSDWGVDLIGFMSSGIERRHHSQQMKRSLDVPAVFWNVSFLICSVSLSGIQTKVGRTSEHQVSSLF